MSADVLPFPDGQKQALLDAARHPGILGLCGPAGSGQRFLLKQAFDDLAEMGLEHEINSSNALQFARKLQPCALGRSDGCRMVTCAIYPAELVTPSAIPVLRKVALERDQVMVLVGCGKIQGLDAREVVYHKPLAYRERLQLALGWGATQDEAHEAVKLCKDDLRQLRTAVTFFRGATDANPHVYFDTRAILSGASRPSHYLSECWIELGACFACNGFISGNASCPCAIFLVDYSA
jgi:hypothetical protein